MPTSQYTIRNIPEPLNRYLRKRAKLSGRSLNQIIIDSLSEQAALPKGDLLESLDWFIGGSGMDDATLTALQEEDVAQKALAAKQFKNL